MAHISEQMFELAQSKGLVMVDLKSTLWQTSAGLAIRKTVKASGALDSFIETVKVATGPYVAG